MSPPITQRTSWRNLQDHYEHLRYMRLSDLFDDDPARGERLTAEGAGIYLDYSKNRVTDETLSQLFALARECGLSERIEAMFRGERINVSEDRPVLHVALRAPSDAVIEVDDANVVPEVHSVLDRMATFADKVRDGEWPTKRCVITASAR